MILTQGLEIFRALRDDNQSADGTLAIDFSPAS